MNLLIYLLFLAALFVVVTTFILLRNTKDLTGLTIPDTYNDDTTPGVSICIPARNEEDCIKQCVQSACNQTYPDTDTEIIVLDDDSEDKTPEILGKLEKRFPLKLSVKQGKPKPADWLGKPWACHQLSSYARGDILIFIDADTTLAPNFTRKAVAELTTRNLDFATVWPSQNLHTFWERLLIPIVYHALLTLLPTIYTHRPPRWMPVFLQRRFKPLFAAAAGQCMIFSRSSYEKIGGHEAVKNKIVEDVEIAKNILREDLKMRMFQGLESISCRMYQSESEIRNGFRKNFLAGFNYNTGLFIAAALLHIIAFLLPYLAFIMGIIYHNKIVLLLSGFIISFIYLQRILLARWFGWSILYGLLHPIGVLWFQYLGLLSLKDFFLNSDVQWKGRKL